MAEKFPAHSLARQMVQKGWFFGETRLKRKGGAFEAELTAIQYHFQDEETMLFFIRDIGDRLKDTERIRLSQKALESTLNGIVICDALKKDYPAIYVNPAFSLITGYEKEEILGKSLRILYGEDIYQPGLEVIREALLNKRHARAVIRNYTKDGKLFWNELSVAPVKNEEGEATHYIGIQNDITERKRFEERLRRSLEKESSFRELLEILTAVLQMLAGSRSGHELLSNICWKLAQYKHYHLVLIHLVENGKVSEAYEGRPQVFSPGDMKLDLKDFFIGMI